jgi:hypothetical protein
MPTFDEEIDDDELPEEYRTPITHSCGWSGMMSDIEWDWSLNDMSDFAGYCPHCKQPW